MKKYFLLGLVLFAISITINAKAQTYSDAIEWISAKFGTDLMIHTSLNSQSGADENGLNGWIHYYKPDEMEASVNGNNLIIIQKVKQTCTKEYVYSSQEIEYDATVTITIPMDKIFKYFNGLRNEDEFILYTHSEIINLKIVDSNKACSVNDKSDNLIDQIIIERIGNDYSIIERLKKALNVIINHNKQNAPIEKF